MITASRVLQIELHEGKYLGFFNCGGDVSIKGWWERKDGSEGGMIRVNAHTNKIEDYDGCGDLPKYVYDELKSLGINTN